MKIEIIISKEEADHLQSPHTFYDACKEQDDVMRKVQKQIDKKLKEKLSETHPKEKIKWE